MILYIIDVPSKEFGGMVEHHVADNVNAHQAAIDRLIAKGHRDMVERKIETNDH